MSSNYVCNHTRDNQIGLPMRGCPILLSLVWLQTELDSTQSYTIINYLRIQRSLLSFSDSKLWFLLWNALEKSIVKTRTASILGSCIAIFTPNWKCAQEAKDEVDNVYV